MKLISYSIIKLFRTKSCCFLFDKRSHGIVRLLF